MAAPKSLDEAFASLEGEAPARVEPGEYLLRFDHYETAVMFGRAPKVVLWFTIVTFGPYFDCVKLPRYYNVTRLIGRPAKSGRFKVGYQSSFLREYGRLFRVPGRLDRIPMSEFARHIIIGRAKTVTHGADQKEIPDGLRYSILEELIGVGD